jgi:hypothetical protein
MIVIGFGLLNYSMELNPKHMEMDSIKVLPYGEWTYPRFKLLLRMMGSKKNKMFQFKLNFLEQMKLIK